MWGHRLPTFPTDGLAALPLDGRLGGRPGGLASRFDDWADLAYIYSRLRMRGNTDG